MPVRAAAVQFAIDDDRDANLATCRRMIDQAAGEGATLIVLPEFCNFPSWYDDDAHARAVAVRPGDDWLAGIADRAATHRAWVMVNATRHGDNDAVYGTNFLFAPDGTLAGFTDKQVLMGGESLHISPSTRPSPLMDTPFGRVGLYSCMDGVIWETPRVLALQGAQVLCNSLNSFAADEATLHVPVRAAENRVWVVAANKVGPLIPAHAIEEVAGKLGVPVDALQGAGESQIVAPDGTVVARGPRAGEAVVVADLDPALADNKRRPGGTDRFAARRPELYAAIASKPRGRQRPVGAPELQVAVVQPDGGPDEAVAAVAAAVADGARLVVLPELAGLFTPDVDDVNAAIEVGRATVTGLADALAGTDAVAVTSIVADPQTHAGVIVGADGVIAQGPALHATDRHRWATRLGDGVLHVDLAWGRLAVVVGDDAIQPESFRLAALADADVVAVSFHAQEPWETAIGLPERSAENRLCLVAATRPTEAGTSLVTTLERDFTLWTVWEERPFDGTISQPRVTPAGRGDRVTPATVHPAHAANRILTRATDVVDSRPWWLLDPLLAPAARRPA
jgi:deaminated glutathione amidase